MQHEADRQRADIWRAVDVWIPQGSSEMEDPMHRNPAADIARLARDFCAFPKV